MFGEFGFSFSELSCIADTAEPRHTLTDSQIVAVYAGCLSHKGSLMVLAPTSLL